MSLRQLREKHGASLGEIACITGIPRPTVQALEKGRYRNPERIAAIKAACEVIGAYKRAQRKEWQELPKRLAQRLKQSQNRRMDR